MKNYVKSRGVSKGYSWLHQNQQEISNPPILKEAIEIVDSDDFSLVLYRRGGQLSLLITGLESQNRIDDRIRRIPNSVLWVGKDSEEAMLRAISIQALNGELAGKVDRAVVSENNDRGFKVDFQEFNKIVTKSLSQKECTDLTQKIGNLSELKKELINELENYSLPKNDGLLVVVSSTVSQSSLESKKVWRSLSDEIPGDDWIEISGANSKKSDKDNPAKFSLNLLRMLKTLANT